jgi:hypothetical protein
MTYEQLVAQPLFFNPQLTRAPQGATPVTLRMQALTAARFDDILAHVSFAGTGSKDSRLYSLWDQTQIWDPGD